MNNEAQDQQQEFGRFLQSAWLRRQLQQRAAAALAQVERLDMIAAWVMGDLDERKTMQAQQAVAEDADCQAFYNLLVKLAEHLKSTDRYAPLDALQDSIEELVAVPPIPMRQPAWGLRGEGRAPIMVNVPAEYGFQIQAAVGGFNQKRYTVQGKTVFNDPAVTVLPDKMVGGSVWLMPVGEYKWYKAALKPDGSFLLENVPPGKYRLEMAWTEDFLEVQEEITI